MTADISNLTNGKLIKLLEKCDAQLSKATNAVFACEERNDVKFCDILNRLGEDHPQVIAYNEASAAMEHAKSEARRRVGPVQFDMFSIYVTYLQNQKSRRKAA